MKFPLTNRQDCFSCELSFDIILHQKEFNSPDSFLPKLRIPEFHYTFSQVMECVLFCACQDFSRVLSSSMNSVNIWDEPCANSNVV